MPAVTTSAGIQLNPNSTLTQPSASASRVIGFTSAAGNRFVRCCWPGRFATRLVV